MEKIDNTNAHQMMPFCSCSGFPPSTAPAIAKILQGLFEAIVLGIDRHYCITIHCIIEQFLALLLVLISFESS